MAAIHPQLKSDCLMLGRFPLCHLLLTNDSNYPWFILVPDRENITEIYELSEADQIQLMVESSALGAFAMDNLKGDKLNVAALGNMVPQLHVHVIVRYKNDAAWPGPIWGKVAAKSYSDAALDELKEKLGLSKLRDFSAAD